MPSEKLRSRETLAGIVRERQGQGKTVGFTSGTFDLLHAGHVDYLIKAKALCDLLIVGVNSDSSVRSYKALGRPLNKDGDRATVIAALECVDFAFVFEESKNNANIAELKPDLYIKAGDYAEDQLSSAPLVREYGGRVEIIPFKSGYSTTGLIEKIASLEAIECEFPPIPSEMAPAIFVDRDGTINENSPYLKDPEKLVMIDGALEALKFYQEKGYWIIVVTNQAGIDLGYFTFEEFCAVNSKMFKEAGKHNLRFDKIYVSPETQRADNKTRKPLPYYVEQAVRELNIDKSRSFFVGDSTVDIACGKNAGIPSVLVLTGHAGKDGVHGDASPDHTIESLRDLPDLFEAPSGE